MALWVLLWWFIVDNIVFFVEMIEIDQKVVSSITSYFVLQYLIWNKVTQMDDACTIADSLLAMKL